MKKSLIALAVLAASGASMAQSSVTLYGILDTYFGSVNYDNSNGTKTGTNAALAAGNVSLSQTVLNSGGVNGSRWGLKGSEDLGGGLKANFDLQAGINIDDGAGTSTSATAFSRQSWVGFSGGFGALRLGRTTTPFDDVSGNSTAMFDSALAPYASVFKSTGYSARQSNMIYYQAPSMGGFSGALSYALGEDKAAAATAPTLTTAGRTADGTSTTSLNLTYAGGPVAAQFAYQTQKTNVVGVLPGAVAASDVSFTRLGGSYNFGVVIAKANYGKVANVANLDGADTTEWQLGLDYPVSSALTLSASYARSSDNSKQSATVVGGSGDVERTGFGLGASYTLSKRTFLYGGYEKDTQTKTGLTDAKHSVLAVGVQHRF